MKRGPKVKHPEITVSETVDPIEYQRQYRIKVKLPRLQIQQKKEKIQ